MKVLDIISHGEMQIKPTLRYHHTPTRMTKIKKADNTYWWWGCGTRMFPVAGRVKWNNHDGQLAVSNEVRHVPTHDAAIPLVHSQEKQSALT